MSRLGVTGEEFWSVAEVSREAAAALPDDHGTTIDAPARVVMSRRDTLPVVGVHTRSFRDVRPVPFQRRAVLVASRVESREAVAGRAFLPKKQPPSPPPPPPDDDTPDGFVNTDFVLDARARLEDLPWRPGTLVLWLVDFDRPTPPAKVELVRTESTDPAVAEFLARRSGGRAYPAAVWPVPALPDAPQGALPRYAADEASPPLPEDEGVALAAERVHVREPGAPLVLRGRFRLRALPREVVVPAPPPALDGEGREVPSGWVDVGDAAATAVLPITLVLTGDTFTNPLAVTLQVPSHDPLPPGDGPRVVTGAFAVDLEALLGPRLAEQTYAVYAVHGEVLSGPALVALLSPEAIPAPGE